MGYASLDQVIRAASSLTFNEEENIRRTKGLWHVLIFLRATVLRNSASLTLTSFDLTEACFDATGIHLPIEAQSRNVYYEPAATNSQIMFRHREGPRQTFLNRMQSGLSGGGNKPNLLTINQQQLPITVSLRPDWIANLRSNNGNREILDDQTRVLVIWLFRFGVPRIGKRTASIGEHSSNGLVRRRDGLTLDQLPPNVNELRFSIQQFFGLTVEDLFALIPNLDGVDCSQWTATHPLGLSELQTPMLNQFGPQQAVSSLTQSAEVAETASGLLKHVTEAASPSVDYSVQWDNLANLVLHQLAATSLVGLEPAALQCIAALRAGKYVILLGAPGTGKTKLAETICQSAIDCGVPDYTMATATADWSTFETIGGYMPSPQNAGHLIFSENVFVESVRTGKWLVIDELNRADIDKAFGELFTLFSGNRVRLSYRMDGKAIVLIPPGEDVNVEIEYPIYLMADWRLIGTMNTFDKASLFQMSYAFMRRFAFVEIEVPSSEMFRQLVSGRAAAELVEPGCSPELRDETAQRLLAIFSSTGDGSLRKIGAGVGPAIALDIVRYIKERYGINQARGVVSIASHVVLEALEMYLYPQFEGRNELHQQIIIAIAKALDLTAEHRNRTGRVLSNWTGIDGPDDSE